MLNPDQIPGSLHPGHHARPRARQKVGRGEHPAHDPFGEREIGVVRVSEGVDLVAEAGRLLVADVENRHFRRRPLDLDDRQVVRGTPGDDAGQLALGAVGKHYAGGRSGPSHNVMVGGDPTPPVDQKAAAVLHAGLACHGHFELDDRL